MQAQDGRRINAVRTQGRAQDRRRSDAVRRPARAQDGWCSNTVKRQKQTQDGRRSDTVRRSAWAQDGRRINTVRTQDQAQDGRRSDTEDAGSGPGRWCSDAVRGPAWLPWSFRDRVCLPMQLTCVQSLGCWEDRREEEMATHSSMLAWETHGERRLADYSPWCHRVGPDVATEQQEPRGKRGCHRAETGQKIPST